MYAFFIRRPIVAISLALLILLGGLFCALTLPVAQYPNIIPPQISLSTSYPGADCNTVVDSIATPIEQQMSGVEGMEYMTSTSTNNGDLTLNITFKVGSEPDMDQVLSYLRYAQANSDMPTEVQQLGVTLRSMSGTPLLLYVLRSPDGDYDATWLSNYAYINLVNPLLRTPGVGNVQVFGAGEYAMRIWLKPDKMAALGLSVTDIRQAVQEQNSVNPIGKIGAAPSPPDQPDTYTVRTEGRLVTVEEFENIILRADSDSVVRLKDVARIELGAQSYSLSATYNGKACAIIAVYQSPGSNALQTVQAVENTLAAHRMPPGLELTQALDTTLSVRLSIQDILRTLVEALLLVILVVFIFLQGWRATLIPLAAVPVSIVGTFIFFPLFGIDINTICLMGLVLAIGLVVDDAIVVVEAVQTQLDAGLSPRDATLAAMKEVAGPVIATALVLAAVIFPCMLISGITGLMYTQFAVTLGVSILLSALNALTLSPALAALLLRPRARKADGSPRENFLAQRFNALIDGMRRRYATAGRLLIKLSPLTALVLIALTLAIGVVIRHIPDGFLPDEDQGYLFSSLQMPVGSSLKVTEKAGEKLTEALCRLPGIQGVVTVNGYNMITGVQSPDNAFCFITLKPWQQRNPETESAAAVTAAINRLVPQLDTGGIGMAMQPPAIPGVGASNDISLMVEDRGGNGIAYLREQSDYFISCAEKLPEIARVSNLMAPDSPQYQLTLHREKALTQGVSLSTAYSTLQTLLGSSFINYFNRFGYQYPVYMQAEDSSRMNISRIKAYYLPGADNSRIPLDSLVDITRSYGPDYIIRQNMYNAAMLNVVAAPGYSSGQAMAALEAEFDRSMPADMGMSYTGMSFQEEKAASGIGLGAVFALSGACAFLLLASLYESWSLPLSIALSVPVAILGALGTLLACGLELNLYAEIGLIMLIGLAAKNAILIVEFAENRRREGMDLLAATLEGAQMRLRPILMTSLAFILGCIPLATATGAGAEARRVIGQCVIGGMSAATAIGILFVPFAYYSIARLRKQTPAQDKPASTPAGTQAQA